MTTQAKDKQLTAKQASFVQYYADSGSDTYNNAYQSAIKAKYAHNTANQACKLILGNIRVRAAIEAYKAVIVAEMDWNRKENMKALAAQLASVNAILLEQPLNVAAITAKTAIIRECNASSNQHSNTVHTEHVDAQPTGAEAEATQAAAKEYKLRLAGSGAPLAGPSEQKQEKTA